MSVSFLTDGERVMSYCYCGIDTVRDDIRSSQPTLNMQDTALRPFKQHMLLRLELENNIR